MGEKIAGTHNWSGDQLREKRDCKNEITQRPRRLENTAINIEGVGEGVKCIKGNADGEKNVEMRRMVDDTDPGNEPLEVLEEEISVFEKPQHAEVHANAGDEPDASGLLSGGFRDSGAEPEIHAGRRKQERGKGRVPRPVENVTRDHEQILPRIPAPYAPIDGDNDYEEDDESERIKKHSENPKELVCRTQQSIYASHIGGSFLDVVLSPCKIKKRIEWRPNVL